jgi:histidyl-tRNA synthetase
MKPSIPKGTRDFLPEEVFKRRYIFNIMQEVFESFGYVPIQTPVMESLSTLTGKYGEEGDRLIFKILNNGDFLSKVNEENLVQKDSKKITPQIAKRALRYDLTVPMARFVSQHRNEITFPFKRYQIEPVWRADRPQKGRYQEFYQCDVDVIGSASMASEAELICIYDQVFYKLGLPVSIKINNRKVLAGMTEVAGIYDQFVDVTIAIDKIDKVGVEGVIAEMKHREIPDSGIEKMMSLLKITDLNKLSTSLNDSEMGKKGVEELSAIFKYLESTSFSNKLIFDASLARGLNYYTGFIVEVVGDENEFGSLGGGGRYDDLTALFGFPGTTGVGVSFGAERIYDLMDLGNLFPKSAFASVKALIVTFDAASHEYGFNVASRLRNAGIPCELFPEPTKMKKQMRYADARDIPYVIIIGDQEMESGKLALKNLEDRSQESLTIEEVINNIK